MANDRIRNEGDQPGTGRERDMNDESTRGGTGDDVRGIADEEDDEFEDTDELDDEEEGDEAI